MSRDLAALSAINEPSVQITGVSTMKEVPERALVAVPATDGLMPVQMLLLAAGGPSTVPPPLPPAARVESLLPLARKTNLALRGAPVRRGARELFPPSSEWLLPKAPADGSTPALLAGKTTEQPLLSHPNLAGKVRTKSPTAGQLKPKVVGFESPALVWGAFSPLIHVPIGLGRPSLALAGRKKLATAKAWSPKQIPVTPRNAALAPHPPLVDVWQPVQFNAICNDGFDEKSLAAVVKPAPTSFARGFGLAIGVSLTVSIAVGLVAYWPSTQHAVAGTPKAAVAPAPVVEPTPVPESAPVNSLSRQIEVTGFRFVTPAGQKPEIHYIVVNHSPVKLSDMTLFVTLRLGDASPGQLPLSRFSIRAPDLPPFESREMTSYIENMTQAVSLPEWQNVKAEVSVSK
jgi:hypothetical protein